MAIEVDERGIPIFDEKEHAASPEAPEKPCQLCAHGNPVHWDGTNFEWCQAMKTCAATIDWDRIHGDE